MPESLIANVSDTAFWVAHYRAVETDRPDALFRDPLARVLAGERGKEIAEEMPLSFFTRWAIVIRTCIIDEYIHFALKQGIDAATFTSSSSVTHLAAVAKQAGIAFPFANVPAISIGPITTHTLLEHNWPPAAEATQSDIQSLAAAVKKLFY